MYGFRVFQFSIFYGARGRKSKPLTSSKVEKFSYFDHLEQCLSQLQEFGTLTGEPKLIGDGADLDSYSSATLEINAPRMRFGEIVADKDSGLITLEVQYGRVGQFEKILALTPGDDKTISREATANLFRVIFAFPKGGNSGILIVEDKGSRNPSKYLPAWISLASKEAIKGDDVGLFSFLEGADMIKMRIEAVRDIGQLKEEIRNAKKLDIEVWENGESESGRRVGKKTKLSQNVTGSAVDTVLGWISGWVNQNKGDEEECEEDDQRVGIAQMVSFIDDEIPAGRFDDGSLIINGKNGIRRVGPGYVDEIFCYKFDNEFRPDNESFAESSLRRAKSLSLALNIELRDNWSISDIEWPEPKEGSGKEIVQSA